MTTEPRQSVEFGWVIIRYINSTIHYWAGGGLGDEWFVTDNDKAIRFARQQDAAYVLSWCFKGNGKVEEHGWGGPA